MESHRRRCVNGFNLVEWYWSLLYSQIEEETYPLLDIDDSQLSPEQLEEKKKQRFLKSTREGKAKAKEEREKAKLEKVYIIFLKLVHECLFPI